MAGLTMVERSLYEDRWRDADELSRRRHGSHHEVRWAVHFTSDRLHSRL
jgi:hypothetical protein